MEYIKYYGYQTPRTKKQALQDYYDLAGGNDYEWALTNETAEAFKASGQSIIEFAQNRANDLALEVINAIPVGGENGFTFEEIRDVLLEDVDTLYRAIRYWLEEKQIQFGIEDAVRYLNEGYLKSHSGIWIKDEYMGITANDDGTFDLSANGTSSTLTKDQALQFLSEKSEAGVVFNWLDGRDFVMPPVLNAEIW